MTLSPKGQRVSDLLRKAMFADFSLEDMEVFREAFTPAEAINLLIFLDRFIVALVEVDKFLPKEGIPYALSKPIEVAREIGGFVIEVDTPEELKP